MSPHLGDSLPSPHRLGCRSSPVRGRPVPGFVLGLLNYLLLPAPFHIIVYSIWCLLLRGCVESIPPPPLGEILLYVALSIAFSALYSLGAALVAGSRESWTSDERAFLGFILAFIPWIFACASIIPD